MNNYKIENLIQKEIDYQERNYTTLDSFTSMLERNYHNKSLSLLTYEIMNIQSKVNKKTGVKLGRFNHYYFKMDKNGKYKIEEFEKGSKLDYYYQQIANINISKTKYLDEHYKNYESFFLTYTLPSEFHFFKAHNGFKRNKKCVYNSINESVIASAKEINKIWRYTYNSIKDTAGRKSISKDIGFVKMLEPMSQVNPTLHLHSVIWYRNKEQKELIEKIYKKTIKKFGLKETKLVKVEKSAVTYVCKYVLKQTKCSFMNQYKAFFGNKFTFFTSSNFKNGLNSKKMSILYNFYNKKFPEKITEIKANNESVYKFLEDEYLAGNIEFEEIEKESVRVNTKLIKEQVREVIDFIKINNKKVSKKNIIEDLEKIEEDNTEHFENAHFLQLKTKDLNSNLLEYLKNMKHSSYCDRLGIINIQTDTFIDDLYQLNNEDYEYMKEHIKNTLNFYTYKVKEKNLNKVIYKPTNEIIYESNLWRDDVYTIEDIDKIVKTDLEVSTYLENMALQTEYRQKCEKLLNNVLEGNIIDLNNIKDGN